MSDHFYFVCHTPEGLPRPLKESVLRVFGPGFSVGDEPEKWDFQRGAPAGERTDEDLTGRRWSVASVGSAHFAVGEVGRNRDVVILSVTGRTLERLLKEFERDGYTLTGLLMAIAGAARSSRCLWLANFDPGPSIRLARRRGLPAEAIPHVYASWGDEDWAKIVRAYGAAADPSVHRFLAFRWPEFPHIPPLPAVEPTERELLLTKATVEQIAADGKLSDLLDDFTAIEDEAAEALQTACGEEETWLALDSLTSLSDTAAESLSRLRGWLYLSSLSSLSDAGARSLLKYEGDISIDLDKLPPSAAAILRTRDRLNH